MLNAFVPNGSGSLSQSASTLPQLDEPLVVELILNIFKNTVTFGLYWNVGMFVKALLFLNVDEKLITCVLYLNNSVGTLTNDVHALKVDENEVADVQLSNKLAGTDVIFVNENVSVNDSADTANVNKSDGIDVILVLLNVLLNWVTLLNPIAPPGIVVMFVHP